MRRLLIFVHLLVLALWLVLSVRFALDIAMAGAEEAGLRRLMGAARSTAAELRLQRDRINAELERVAVPVRVLAAARRLGLTLQAPAQGALARNEVGSGAPPTP